MSNNQRPAVLTRCMSQAPAHRDGGVTDRRRLRGFQSTRGGTGDDGHGRVQSVQVTGLRSEDGRIHRCLRGRGIPLSCERQRQCRGGLLLSEVPMRDWDRDRKPSSASQFGLVYSILRRRPHNSPILSPRLIGAIALSVSCCAIAARCCCSGQSRSRDPAPWVYQKRKLAGHHGTTLCGDMSSERCPLQTCVCVNCETAALRMAPLVSVPRSLRRGATLHSLERGPGFGTC